MPMPRVGLRAFLLMTTLASLLAATVALWMRAGYRISALEHASKAERPRNLAEYFGERAAALKRLIDSHPDSPSVPGWRMELKAAHDRYLELIAEAEAHERLARYYER
jgi:hypothetical protein